jgi:hypothetical protein
MYFALRFKCISRYRQIEDCSSLQIVYLHLRISAASGWDIQYDSLKHHRNTRYANIVGFWIRG